MAAQAADEPSEEGELPEEIEEDRVDRDDQVGEEGRIGGPSLAAPKFLNEKNPLTTTCVCAVLAGRERRGGRAAGSGRRS